MSEMFEGSDLNVQQGQPPVETIAETNDASVTTDTVANTTADTGVDTTETTAADDTATELELPFDLSDDSK